MDQELFYFGILLITAAFLAFSSIKLKQSAIAGYLLAGGLIFTLGQRTARVRGLLAHY